MTEAEINEFILDKLKEIRAMLEENGGIQKLSMSIFEDGAILFFNTYGLAGCTEEHHKGLNLDGYLRGGK